MTVMKKSPEIISYQNSGQNMTYFNIIAADKQEVLQIRCYQRYKFDMIKEGMTFKFSNMIKKKDCCWIISSSTIGYSAKQDVGTFPPHKLLLPEEEPPTGMKRSLKDALESPQKSTVVGKVIKVCNCFPLVPIQFNISILKLD